MTVLEVQPGVRVSRAIHRGSSSQGLQLQGGSRSRTTERCDKGVWEGWDRLKVSRCRHNDSGSICGLRRCTGRSRDGDDALLVRVCRAFYPVPRRQEGVEALD